MEFELGMVVTTKGVHDLMSDNAYFRKFVFACMKRYMECDWGELCVEDARLNDEAVINQNGRILAAYECYIDSSLKIWIITEQDRSATTILFPHEY